MIEFVNRWIINIVALVLFIVIIEMLVPYGKMKKFVGLVTGTVLIITIISPFLELSGKGLNIIEFQTSNSIQLDKLQIEKESKLLEEEQIKQTVEVYRDKIIGQIEMLAMEDEEVKKVRADVIFNEDHNSEGFGEIKRMYLEIEEKGLTENISGRESSIRMDEAGNIMIDGIKKIDPVIIGNSEPAKADSEECSPELKRRLTDRLSQVFGIKSEDIIISRMAG